MSTPAVDRVEQFADGLQFTLVSLGLAVRVLFAKCGNVGEDGKEQWSVWSGDDWRWPITFKCPHCGNHWLTADRYEEWPFKT